ncbi:hypothetical protein [Mycolicibacter kumamotonensis]|uniref:hypothetical protein n=1 Tax=Mycolicibacter kumamotonensis TaxID=354243 RepID=UPI0008066996|nr:hypothetical protein [Mycolicibacter kumamotonensis]
MKRISIERYKNPAETGSAGLIEGETDDGRRWIMFLDEQGAPQLFWPERGEDGAVVGAGMSLTPDAALKWVERGWLQHAKKSRQAYQEILDTDDPVAQLREIVDIYDQQIARRES